MLDWFHLPAINNRKHIYFKCHVQCTMNAEKRMNLGKHIIHLKQNSL